MPFTRFSNNNWVGCKHRYTHWSAFHTVSVVTRSPVTTELVTLRQPITTAELVPLRQTTEACQLKQLSPATHNHAFSLSPSISGSNPASLTYCKNVSLSWLTKQYLTLSSKHTKWLAWDDRNRRLNGTEFINTRIPSNTAASPKPFTHNSPLCWWRCGAYTVVIPGSNPKASVSTIEVQLVIHHNTPASPFWLKWW